MRRELGGQPSMGISIALVRNLVQAVERSGVTREAFLQKSELSPDDIEDSDRRIDLAEYDRLQLLALEVTGDEAIGFHLAEWGSLAVFDVLGALSLHAPTMRDGIQALRRYHRIMSDCADPELLEEGDRALLRYEFPRSHPRCNQIRAEFGLTVLFQLAKSYLADGDVPRRTSFEHAAPPYVAEYDRVFGGSARFREPFTGFEFDRAWLERPQLHMNRGLFFVLADQAERRLTRLAPASIAARVRAILQTQRPRFRPTMEEIAKQLGMSARSLRRRLSDEGVPFLRLAEEAQMLAARDMLDNVRLSIQEVAYSMGFSEPSAFHRAFKRWTGMTPKQYRELGGSTADTRDGHRSEC